jgi:hypothetical protein
VRPCRRAVAQGRPAGGRKLPVGSEKAPQRPVRGCRRPTGSRPASRHRTYAANPLSIQVRKRWTSSAGHGP